MKKLAIFFPGIGYTVDKPLLYYSRRIASDKGYEIKLLPYTGFPQKIMGDRGRMEESYQIALRQTEDMLSGMDFSVYGEILLIGKSIGTIVAAQWVEKSPFRNRIRMILYTPLEETFSFPLGEAIVFTGSADPWVGKQESRIWQLCREKHVTCHIIPDANHSLECGDVQKDLQNLQMIMKVTKEFMGK